MIYDIPRIKVSGIEYPVYAVDFSWGGADGPSKLTMDIINSSGNYKSPKLNSAQAVTVEFGGFFKFIGYPVSWSKRNSTNGNVLTVSYLDTSIILDKIFIGLKGLHGAAPPNLEGVILDGTIVEGFFGPNLLLLGTYVDPCEGIVADTVDPCNPCLTRTEFVSVEENNSSKLIKCDEERLLSLLDVNYRFTDLINGLRSKGIQFFDIPNVNVNIYARYTGSARDVLRSWCSDLGLTFIWENSGIRFIDLKKGITINDSNFYTSCQLLESTESESIENSKAVGNIFYFGAEGQINKYDCSGAMGGQFYKLSMIPITLKDIFTLSNGHVHPFIKKYYNINNGDSIRGLQSAVVLSYYSKMLRDMTLLYNFYDVTDASDIEPDTKFPLLGMTVKETWDVAAASDTFEGSRRLFWEHIPESIRKRASHIGAALAVVEINEKWHDQFYEFEHGLASDFMGKYWISFFSKGDKYSYSGPDGSPEYFDAGTPLTLPFIDLIPESVQSQSPFLERIINQSAERNKSSEHVGAVVTDNPNTFAHSFLLMERNASWEPLSNSDSIKIAEESIRELYFYNIEPFKQEGVGDELKPNEYYMLIFDKPTKFDLTYYGETAHPIEKENKNRTTELEGYNTTYGLRSDLCRPYRLEIKSTGNADNPSIKHVIDIAPPVQSHENYGIDFPGYTIIASKNSDDSESSVYIPRKEYIYGDVPVLSDECTGFIVNLKDYTSTIQSILTETATSCEYSTTEIRSIINSLKLASARPKEIKQISRTYSLDGFPTRELKLEDGMSGFSVRYGTSNGLGAEIQFSNSPPITKSDNLIDQEVETNILRRKLGRRFRSSRNKINV